MGSPRLRYRVSQAGTVGDPFKDTSGPSINILIKLLSMVSIVFSGLIASFHLF